MKIKRKRRKGTGQLCKIVFYISHMDIPLDSGHLFLNKTATHSEDNNSCPHFIFTDSGIIGTKEFVYQNYQRFKDRFQNKNEKIPKPVAGLEGIYSLKRLSEA